MAAVPHNCDETPQASDETPQAGDFADVAVVPHDGDDTPHAADVVEAALAPQVDTHGVSLLAFSRAVVGNDVVSNKQNAKNPNICFLNFTIPSLVNLHRHSVGTRRGSYR